jgi:hypothetical protein
MKKTVEELLKHCKTAVKNNVQYVYGAKMQVLTLAQIKALQQTYGTSYVWNSDLNKAGKLCCDCSGLISSCTGVPRGSANYKATAVETVTVATVKKNWSKYVGWAFWLNGHIGVVSDTEGYYYAMDGSARNMVHYPISRQKWVYALKLCDVDYTEKADTETKSAEVKGDEEMVEKGTVNVNGKDYEVDRILKDGSNYVKLADFGKMGFDVGYNSKTKVPSITNTNKELKISVDGKETSLESVNINGSNYVPIRSLASATGAFSVDYINGATVIETK